MWATRIAAFAAGAKAAAISYAERWKPTADKFKAHLVDGKWRRPELSLRKKAMLRKEALLKGEPWPFDDPPKEKVVKLPKGHKWEREKHLRVAKIQKALEEQPAKIAEYRKNIVKKPPKKGSWQYYVQMLRGDARAAKAK
eukprot:tig00020938_g16127.t1